MHPDVRASAQQEHDTLSLSEKSLNKEVFTEALDSFI